MTHLKGDSAKDTAGQPLVLIIMPIPMLNAIGAAPLPVRLDRNLPHFNLELVRSTGNIPNPVLEVCANTGAGISYMHISTMVHYCLNYPDSIQKIFHCTDRAFAPITLSGIVSVNSQQVT